MFTLGVATFGVASVLCAGLAAIAAIGLAVANDAYGLTVHGFHEAMLITAVLVMAGGAIGAAGIRND